MIVVVGSISLVRAQDNRMNKKAMQQIEAARIGMITERLGLSPDQAQRFWPMGKVVATEV